MTFLSSEEHNRYHRFLVPDPAHTFLASRLLLRSVLSLYDCLPPAEWHFETNQYGCPRVANREAPAGLRFNISHKPTMVTCLTGAGRDLGVDVEDASAARPYLFDIAARFFSASEAAALPEVAPGRRQRRFYEYWTLKEAYMKARGIGLSLGLGNFSFSVIGDRAAVRFAPGFEDDPATWDFRLFRPDGRHCIATAVRRKNMPLSIKVFDGAAVVHRALANASNAVTFS